MAPDLAQLIAAILYDDWNPLGANPPANEYLREGIALAEMLPKGASREEVTRFCARPQQTTAPIRSPKIA